MRYEAYRSGHKETDIMESIMSLGGLVHQSGSTSHGYPLPRVAGYEIITVAWLGSVGRFRSSKWDAAVNGKTVRRAFYRRINKTYRVETRTGFIGNSSQLGKFLRRRPRRGSLARLNRSPINFPGNSSAAARERAMEFESAWIFFPKRSFPG